MIRIAFTMIGGKSWIGGYNYLINLLKVITAYHPTALQPVLFFGTDTDPDEILPFEAIGGIEIITSSALNADKRVLSLITSLIFGANPSTRRLFREHRIEIVFENAQYHGAHLGIPAIAWIPDFQHRELPQLFSRSAWWKRELGFRAQISGGRTIMLSSADSRETCERYYPATVGRTHVVRFAVPSAHRPDAFTAREVCDIYGIPEHYFYLPNQFWQHKNHLLVIEALALLKHANPDIIVVASGKQLDPNKPDHFERILSRVSETGVESQFRLLGMIPYEHVAPLMVDSVAVLNPSLFEGWSTTVEEARALKVPLILSDLAVHKEQAGGIAHFFDRTCAKSLANALLSAWLERNHAGVAIDGKATSVTYPVQRFADDFVKLVQLVADGCRSDSKLRK